MDSDWPEAVVEYESFLQQMGLQLQRREEQPVFSNKVSVFSDGGIAARIVSDKGIWFAEISDQAHRPAKWYDAAIIRDLLFGHGNASDVPAFPEQAAIVTANWPRILAIFDDTRQEQTHAQLAALKKERAKRRFPNARFKTT